MSHFPPRSSHFSNSRNARKGASGVRRRPSGLAPAGIVFRNNTSYHFPAAAGRRPSESTDGRPPISMARGEGSRPRVAPRIPARAPRATSADTWRAFPPKTSGPITRPRRGLPRAAQAAGTGYFFASVSGLPHPTGPARSHDPRAFKTISGAFESCAVRERQVARPVSRRRAARPTGPPIARECGARRHLPSCGSEHQRPPALQDAPSLPIRAPCLAMPTAQARMTRARGLHATRSRFRSDDDASSLPERRIERRFFLFRWHRAYTSHTGNVSPYSDLHRPVGWFPDAYDQRALSGAHQGNMRLRRYSHLQLHVAVPAYSQVTHSVRVMQLQLPALAEFCKYRSNRYSQFTRSHTCSLLATQKVPSAILSYIT